MKSVSPKDFIVIVEEDDLIRELLERWLGEAGYMVVVEEATCGGKIRVHQDAPCLVIANIPCPSGARQLIQSLQGEYAAPILLLSARFRRGLGGSTEPARRLGVQRVLPKPFTQKELLCAVRESIAERA
jgi:DNA-binding response OmpR family regulator